MPAVVVVGAQWGDEGKGKIVDLIAEGADMVVRYAGGANAGHTLRVGGEKLVTHLLPSGVMHPGVACVLGPGMVIDPKILVDEIAACESRGLDVRRRLLVSGRAHVTLPFQSAMDRAANAGPRAIGTTGRGIGPTYSDKAARVGVRLGDVCHRARCRPAVAALVEVWCERARAAGVAGPSLEDTLAWLDGLTKILGPLVGDASRVVHDALASGKSVVFEGAQGALLDLDHGTYPYVTSSSTVAGGACTGAGVGPTAITGVVGITKAYSTRVGNGVFPTEVTGDASDQLRALGEEYGATTGRPRRCGWLDLPALRYAARVNGLTSLAVTKLDVLDSFKMVPVCVGYALDGSTVRDFPVDDIDRATPVYEDWPGWDASVSTARNWDELPAPARDFLSQIEAAVGVPVSMVSVGARRDETIVRWNVLR